jgi:uncharacterized repeat protein (TIGR03803 family)
MKYFLLTIGLLFSSVLFVESQTLYGTTFYGGTDRGGTVDKFIVGPNNFTVLKSFETIARHPQYTHLVQASDGKLYGMTSEGGGFNAGVIFSYDPNSSTYSKIKDFDITNGGNPYGSLIQAADENLYGMTSGGGNYNRGVIFSYNAGSGVYQKLMDFDSSNGSTPYGSLLQANDGKLYGMTTVGGSGNRGVLFSYDIALSTFTKLKDLDDNGGDYPYGSLIQASDGKLYGMTSAGGATSNGVVFSFDPASSLYQTVYDFDGTNGTNPFGDLLQASDGILYGVTSGGGSSGFGVIFGIDPITSIYSKLGDFDNSEGRYSYGSLVETSDGKLYGTTWTGGPNNPQFGIIFSFDRSTLTFTTVHAFENQNGTFPFGSLVRANDGKLYGLTSSDGDGRNSGIESGVIFSFDPATTTYTVLKQLGSNDDGTNASAALTRGEDGKLYGMTAFGGDNSGGVIYSYDPSTSVFTKLKNLQFNDGSHPFGSLIQAADGKFYGMTAYGGAILDEISFERWGDLGVIFSFDPGSSDYTMVKDLTTDNGSSGGHPYGGLVQADNGKLYGMTSQNGGGYRGIGAGIIFSFDPVMSLFSKLKDFANFSPDYFEFDVLNGSSPYGSFLKASDGKLYGMTSSGGNNGGGVIFSYDPLSDTYTKLVDLDDANGAHPYGTLIQARDGKLYGMTYDGGNNNAGVIFSFDPSTSQYTKLFDLDFNDGANPYGNLMQASDGNLYGMTSGGGANDLGVIFSFDPVTATYTKLLDYDGSNGSTPYIGSAFVELGSLAPLPFTLISFSGENKGNVNKLSWEIESDQDLDYFELQRSTDGQNFNDIAQIKNDGKLTYKFNDHISGDTNTVYYYRLKIVGLKGNFKYSDVIRITVDFKQDFVHANPNPFEDVLLITVNSPVKDNARFVLTDLTGRQVLTKNEVLSRGSNIIQISDNGRLPSGTYILTITTSSKKESIKVIKTN